MRETSCLSIYPTSGLLGHVTPFYGRIASNSNDKITLNFYLTNPFRWPDKITENLYPTNTYPDSNKYEILCCPQPPQVSCLDKWLHFTVKFLAIQTIINYSESLSCQHSLPTHIQQHTNKLTFVFDLLQHLSAVQGANQKIQELPRKEWKPRKAEKQLTKCISEQSIPHNSHKLLRLQRVNGSP